jgi:hypothetical protein
MLTKEQANFMAEEIIAQQRRAAAEIKSRRRRRVHFWYQVADLRSFESEKQLKLFGQAQRLVIKNVCCWMALIAYFSCIGYGFYLEFPQSMKFIGGAFPFVYFVAMLIRLPFLRWHLARLVKAEIGRVGAGVK